MLSRSDLLEDWYPCGRRPADYCDPPGGCAYNGGPCEGCYYGYGPSDRCPGRLDGEEPEHCDCYAKGHRCCHCASMKPTETDPATQEQK